AFAIDDAELTRAVEQAVAVGVASAVPAVSDLVDRRVLDLALLSLPATIDLAGESWTPIEVVLPLE
ncbi:MAG: hypothetical protein ACKOFX_00640, partial [Solirubrobacterales bacterium]